jgi:hypothetical protein
MSTKNKVFYVKEVINAYFTILSYIRYSLLLKIIYVHRGNRKNQSGKGITNFYK